MTNATDVTPRIHDDAWVAPSATLVGDVSIGAATVVLHGAVITAESGPVHIGRECVIMENAVLRGVAHHPLRLDDNILVGPHAHLTGCRVEREVFVATGASIFNGAVLEEGCIVKINGIVHVRTRLSAGAVVPINWVAVGDPAQVLPPEDDERLAALLRERNFSRTVFGMDRDMTRMTKQYAAGLRDTYRNLRAGTRA